MVTVNPARNIKQWFMVVSYTRMLQRYFALDLYNNCNTKNQHDYVICNYKFHKQLYQFCKPRFNYDASFGKKNCRTKVGCPKLTAVLLDRKQTRVYAHLRGSAATARIDLKHVLEQLDHIVAGGREYFANVLRALRRNFGHPKRRQRLPLLQMKAIEEKSLRVVLLV